MNSNCLLLNIVNFLSLTCVPNSRDGLRSDLQKMSQHATTSGKSSIEDRRRKLEDRLDHFNQKAAEFIGENGEEDLAALSVIFYRY